MSFKKEEENSVDTFNIAQNKIQDLLEKTSSNSNSLNINSTIHKVNF